MALSVVKRPIVLKYDTTATPNSATFTSGSQTILDNGFHGMSTGNYVYIPSGEYTGIWYVNVLSTTAFEIREYATADSEIMYGTGTITWLLATAASYHFNAAHNPIVYKLKSTLWPTNSVDTARTVSSYANDLGYAKLTLSGTHGTTELEFVKVTFTGGTTEVYQVLTWYSTTVITINLPYRAGITFVSVQKYYADYHAKIKIYAGISGSYGSPFNPVEEICEIKSVPDSDGVITVNVNEYLKSKIGVVSNGLKSDVTYTVDFDSYCSFYITYAEAYTYSTGGYTLLDYVGDYTDDSANASLFAVNASLPFKNVFSGMMSDYQFIASRKMKFLTPFRTPVLFATESRTLGPVSQFFDISFIQSLYAAGAGNIRMRRAVIRDGVLVNEYIDSITNIGVGVYRYELDRSSHQEDRIELTVQGDSGGGSFTDVSETKVIEVDDECGPAEDFIDLSWKNNTGGHDYWRFKALSDYGIDVESTTEASKNFFSDWPNSWGADADTIDFETSRKSRQTIVVRAENLSKEQAEDLAKIKTSPLVQIVNDRTDRRTVILDKSSFVYVKEGERLYSLTFNLRYTDLLPSQSL